MIIAICFIGIVILIAKIIIDSGHDEDAAMRRARLIEYARRGWPELDLCSALDRLYAEILRQIKTTHKKGGDTTELQEDLFAIQNERNRLLLAEDADCAIDIKQN